MPTRAERRLSAAYGREIEVLYRQSRELVRSLRTGDLPAEIPGELAIAWPVSFVCSSRGCAGENLTLPVRRGDPDPPCPRCGALLARGAWQLRRARVRRHRGVVLLRVPDKRLRVSG